MERKRGHLRRHVRPRQRIQRTVPLMAVASLAIVAVACVATEATVDVNTWQLHGYHPPYWVCATATPLPTATPPPSPTPVPVGPGTPTPTPIPWPPSDIWPPTPYPTPTPYYHYGEFFPGQNVWLPTEYGTVRIAFAFDHHISAPEGYICNVYVFQVKSFVSQPFLLPLSLMVFVRDGEGNIYSTDVETLQRFYGENVDQDAWWGSPPDQEYKMDDEKTVGVPICFPSSTDTDSLQLGMFVDIFRPAAVGTQGHGRDIRYGADSTVWFHRSGDDPYCSKLADPNGNDWPEVEFPPPPPEAPVFPLDGDWGRLSTALPVPMSLCHITRGFGCSEFPTGVSGAGLCPPSRPWWHTGLDIGCPLGTPVYHVGPDGTIYWWGWNGDGYGNLVGITAPPGEAVYKFLYAHLSTFGGDPETCPGTPDAICRADSYIGGVGSTGFSTGPHLHFEVRVNGVPVDPLLHVGGSQRGNAAPTFQFARLEGTDDLACAGCAVGSAPPPPDVSDATFVVRLEDGTGVDNATVTVLDPDTDAAISSCTTEGGTCTVHDLPAGVYPFRLSGTLDDGTPIAPYGGRIRQAMDWGTGDYFFGPLAFYHLPSEEGSLIGIVLVVSPKQPQAQPYLDASPNDAPTPLIPDGKPSPPEEGRHGGGETPPQPAAQPTPAPSVADRHLFGLLIGLFVVVLTVAFVIGAKAREWMERHRHHRKEEDKSADET